MRTITAADSMVWKIEEAKETNKNTTLLCYRKYLDEALCIANDGKNSIKLYYEVLKHFKEQISPHIETTSSGEYALRYTTANSWFHRDKNRIMQSFYEFTLKRVCLKDSVDFMESLKRVFSMKLEDILKK